LPRLPLLFSLFTLCAVVQMPWVVLFARGAGLLEAWGALTASIALGAMAVSVWARPRRIAFLASAMGALLLAWEPSRLGLAALSTVCAPFAVRAAQRDAHEQPGMRFKLTRPASALAALYIAHLLRLFRVERSRLSAAFSAAAAGSAGTVLSLRNDPSERPVQRALIVMALPFIVAAAVCVAPLLENERCMHAVLRSLRVRPRTIFTAFLLAVATPASALAATGSVVVSASAQLERTSFGFAMWSWAAALGCAVALWGRFLERRARRGTGIFVAGVTLIAALATMGASAW
jgi:hypothetical protein